VQILVVVAIIQVRTLKTEVGKGSVTTAFVHGLVGPKALPKGIKRGRYCSWGGNPLGAMPRGAEREPG